MKSEPINGNGWTLRNTIGSVVCGPVYIGDQVLMPDGSDITVLGGRARYFHAYLRRLANRAPD